VPKGPTPDPQEKRLAIRTEDHPIEYQDFEGMIPEGNYGAGAMIVWDRGQWIPHEGDKVGLDKGKLLFELRGYKLRGVWTLFKLGGRSKPNEWMLVKKPDGWARDAGDAELPAQSVLSGLTVEELRAGGGRCAAVRAALEAEGVPRRAVDASKQQVMLATAHDAPFSRAGWIFELKYDGFRLLASKSGGRTALHYRRGSDATHLFPDIARAVSALPVDDLVLDGEVVVLDERSHPSFQRLQQRTQLTRALDIQRAALRLPATYFGFDLLAFDGHDLRGLPLLERKRHLEPVLPPAGPLRYCDHVAERGEDFYAGVETMGLEGIVAKKADSTYGAGRSKAWLKIRVDRRDDFVIVGFTRAKGLRDGIGALHLAQFEGDELRCETRLVGFDEKRIHHYHEMFHARDGYLAATTALLSLHVDLAVRRASPMPDTIRRSLGEFADLRIEQARKVGHATVYVGKTVLARQVRGEADEPGLAFDVRIGGQGDHRAADQHRCFRFGKVRICRDRVPPVLLPDTEMVEHGFRTQKTG